MEDNLSKYLKLTGSILLSFFSFIMVLAFIMIGLRFFFGIVGNLSWFVFLYMLFILSVPAAIFVTAFIVFYKRTASHPSKIVRIESRILFIIAFVAWLVVYVMDILKFARYGYEEIEKYYSFNLLFLFCNVFCIFLVGVLQALTTEKEKDWHDRVKH
ncbi:MAG: hypothetical protein ABIY51_15145 [Ferruginibacter sp.]